LALRLPKKAAGRFIDDDCMTMAAGLIFSRDVVQHQITGQIQGLIGQDAARQVGAMVQNAGQHQSTGIVSAALGLLALLFGATGAFTQLQHISNQVHQVPSRICSGTATTASRKLIATIHVTA
jgi:membrane protein